MEDPASRGGMVPLNNQGIATRLPFVQTVLHLFSFVSSLFDIRESDGFPLEEFVPVIICNDEGAVHHRDQGINESRKEVTAISTRTSARDTQGIVLSYNARHSRDQIDKHHTNSTTNETKRVVESTLSSSTSVQETHVSCSACYCPLLISALPVRYKYIWSRMKLYKIGERDILRLLPVSKPMRIIPIVKYEDDKDILIQQETQLPGLNSQGTVSMVFTSSPKEPLLQPIVQVFFHINAEKEN